VYTAGLYDGPERTSVLTFAGGIVVQIEGYTVGCRAY